MGKTTTEMANILATGASLKISGSGKTTTELSNLAATAKRYGGHLTITNLSGKTTTELSSIGKSGQSHVTLDIS